MHRALGFALSAAFVLVLAQPAAAATILFDIFIDGLQETPPNASPGTGTGSLSLDDTTGDYTISGTFAALLGTTTAAHIHGPAPFGAPAGIVDPLTIDLGVTSGSFSGSGTFDAGEMTSLLAELYYVNIHSTFFAGGEIRGQIVLAPVPEPGTLALVALGSAAFAAASRRGRLRRNG